MKSFNQRQLESDAPHLRIFRGDENDGPDDHLPPTPDRRIQQEWLHHTIFWAGRSRTGLHPSRLVA